MTSGLVSRETPYAAGGGAGDRCDDGAVTRELLFDPTDPDTWPRRRRRYDLRLLRDGHVHRVDDPAALRTATATLRDLGYRVHDLDASGWRTVDELHGALAAALSFPGYYGRNVDALNDVLRDVAEFAYGADPASTGTVLAIDGYDRVVEIDPEVAHAVLDVFASAARYGALLGHPMICLVTTGAELEEVGATPVTCEEPR